MIQENIPFKEIIEKYFLGFENEDIKACSSYATDSVRSEEIHVDMI
jgi:uncharacterized protein (DUF433 family)